MERIFTLIFAGFFSVALGACSSQNLAPSALKAYLAAPNPSARYMSDWAQLESGQKASQIEMLLDVVENDRTYARFVAARILFALCEETDNHVFITQRWVDVVAMNLTRSHIQGPTEALLPLEADIVLGGVLQDELQDPNAWFNFPLQPRFDVEVDHVTIPIPSPSHHGWVIGGNYKIYLDGHLLREHRMRPGTMPLPQAVHVYLHEALHQKGLKPLGKHTWTVEFDVIAPNGMRKHVRREWSFEVISEGNRHSN